MDELKIELLGNKSFYQPGSELIGKASWHLQQSAETIEIRLFWFTDGTGPSCLEQIGAESFDHPAIQESRGFRFQLPQAPYSMKGHLFSVKWALELVVDDGKKSTRAEFVVSPLSSSEGEIVLEKID